MLGDYIARAAATPWDWGSHDCCTFIANWAIECGWPDPLAFLRGRYATEFQALRLIQEGAGLVELVSRGMMNVGIPETGEPRSGDVGVIERLTQDGTNQACAIFSDGKWISLGISGIEAGPAGAIKAWAL